MLIEQERQQLVSQLNLNVGVFAWELFDMPGISPEVMSHKLRIYPGSKPVQQKVRRLNSQRQQIIQLEVSRLLNAGFIREVYYPDWLANVVVVPTKEGKQRDCIDVTDLNEACPKGSFPLPSIHQIIIAISGHKMLSFIDVFSSYNQIPIYLFDIEKTVFITPFGTFCYNVMFFSLKNVRATYQQLMTKIFYSMLGKRQRSIQMTYL